jgi:hypothetical protein
VKRSGRDEPMWVSTHMWMEAMPGIWLSSFQTSKNAMLFLLSFMFFQQNQRIRGQNKFCLGQGEVAQIMHRHESKCKNNKIKIKNK